MALNYLIHENVSTPCTHYFDDFTIIVPEVISKPADQMTGEFLKELGWDVKREKDKPMSSTFTALGVEIDLNEAIRQTDPRITVRNKESRVDEICSTMQRYISRKSMTPAEALELRGKLVFFNSQTYGRKGALAYYHLGLQAKQDGSHIKPELR